VKKKYLNSMKEAFYKINFKYDFLAKKGLEFQDWFCELAKYVWSDDFERIRPNGKQGDWKCDGRQISTGTIFQAYTPERPRITNTINKINSDFEGAKKHWPDFMKKWIFVYNDPNGLPPEVARALDKLRNDNPCISISSWTKEDLFANLYSRLNHESKEMIFGPVPEEETFKSMTLEDLEPVIDSLMKVDLDPRQELPPPPSHLKLEKNNLSEDASNLLLLGRSRVRLVEILFQKSGPVEMGEKIAESFRNRYCELNTYNLSADEIFMYLQKFAHFFEKKSPNHQAAVMAVLAYLFDNCDIFEDPELDEE